MEHTDLYLIGGISTSHGVKGEVKLRPITEDVDLLRNLTEVTLELGGKWIRYEVQKCRPASDHWLLHLQGINDRNLADTLKQAQVYVDASQVRPLEEGEFFIHDLMDATCYSTSGEELGTIVSYFDNGAQMVFEVTGKHHFLFPATEEILKEIHPEEKRVVIHPIEGLLELNRS